MSLNCKQLLKYILLFCRQCPLFLLYVRIKVHIPTFVIRPSSYKRVFMSVPVHSPSPHMYFCHFTNLKHKKVGKFSLTIFYSTCVSYLRRSQDRYNVIKQENDCLQFLSTVTPDWPQALHLLSPLIRLLLSQLINRLSLLRPGQIILCNIYYTKDIGRTKMTRHAALQSELRGGLDHGLLQRHQRIEESPQRD